MPLYLATYDIRNANPSPYGKFVEKAKTLGWSDWIKAKDQKLYKLPNTTLVGNFTSIIQAQNAFFQAASLAGAEGYNCLIEKWIITEMAENAFNSDVVSP